MVKRFSLNLKEQQCNSLTKELQFPGMGYSTGMPKIADPKSPKKTYFYRNLFQINVVLIYESKQHQVKKKTNVR